MLEHLNTHKVLLKRITAYDKINPPTVLEIPDFTCNIQRVSNKSGDERKLKIFSFNEIKDKDEVFYKGKRYAINAVEENFLNGYGCWVGELDG